MVKKCLECKYYEARESSIYGRCRLNDYLTRTNETCTDFTAAREESKSSTALEELEDRVSKLEKLMMRIL